MKDYRKIILGPVITEKSTVGKDMNNTYAFEVAVKANKKEIKDAVEKLFSVNVTDVRTVMLQGKVKKTRWIPGKRKNRKKAYVTLKENQRIELFEGA